MYNVSQDYIDALEHAVQDYKLNITINGVSYDDSIIVGGSFVITNQCSEGDTVQIGSVYTAELKAVVANGTIERNTWEGVIISASEGMRVGEDENGPIYEYVPLGVFTVSEANHTEDGVQIVAYDNMLKFDKSFNLSTTLGTAWSILSLLCQDCGVECGMTQAEVTALPNGTQSIALYSQNDCETYRDVLFWLSQLLCCFATMGRDGKLYLRQYPETSDRVMICTDEARFEGGSFSDFVTEYTGVGFTDIDSQEYIYVSEGLDNKLTYNLGANPFMQYGTDSTKKQMALMILRSLKKISYTPFRTGYLNTPAYDLGDVIRNNDGIADDTFGCIMWFEYDYSSGYQVEGFGQNPALATARNKVDKELSGLMSQTKKDEIQFYTFKNSEAKTVGDGQTEQLMYIRFSTMESKQVVFQGEVLCDADVTLDEIVAQISYRLDGAVITDYVPTETWSEDGKHIISLYYVIDVEPNTLYRWQVFLNSTGGTISIPVENIRGTIWGQGLVSSEKWDGYIDVEDTIGGIDITRRIELATFTDDLEVEPIAPHEVDAEDTISGIDITRRIGVASIDDTVYINKTSLELEGITWGELEDAELTWGEVEEEHLW